MGSNSMDTIYLRYNGEQAEQKIELKEEVELTIKAGLGYRPVLTFGATGTGSDKESTFFRLLGGKVQLQFEGVEFLLRPRAEFSSQALLTFFGDGQVAFKDCVITLDQGNFTGTSLALASFPDLSKSMMKMDPATPPRRRAKASSHVHELLRPRHGRSRPQPVGPGVRPGRDPVSLRPERLAV